MNTLFTIHGIVMSGKKRGKRLGFPTINIPVDRSLPQGIYVSQAQVDDTIYNALTFIGEAKTFNESDFQAETYLFDFSRDIYGKTVVVHLLKKLRENMKFDSEEALVQQMEKDKIEAKKHFPPSGWVK